MSRLFYYSKDKYFSFQFPFQLVENEFGYYSVIYHHTDISSQIISTLVDIFSEEDSLDSLYNILEYGMNKEKELDNIEADLYSLLMYLLTFEPGYIRYDHDIEHANGNLHPEYHLDLYYSSCTTTKIGLNHRLSQEEFINILDSTIDCIYLET